MNLKEKMCFILLISSSSNVYYATSPVHRPDDGRVLVHSNRSSIISNRQTFVESQPLSPSSDPEPDPHLRDKKLTLPPSALSQAEREPISPTSSKFRTPRSNESVASDLSYQSAIDHEASFADLPTPQTHIYIPYNHDDAYVHIVGKRFNEKVGYDDLYYWECKVDKLLSIIHSGYSDIDEDDIEEIRRNAPELYSKYRRQFEEYMAKRVEDKPLLFSESGFVLYIPEEIARGEKKQEHKEEVIIHFTSDPNLFDRVFRVVLVKEREKVSEASRIRREKQEAEYREYQRAHAEQYRAKKRMIGWITGNHYGKKVR